MAVTITRTAWIDDDGTGTTGTIINNAVKTELYNQIDQALALVVPGAGTAVSQTVGAWTPIDKSGAGLTFSSASGQWVKVGSLCLVTLTVRYPATADGLQPKISLPFLMAVFGNGGLYCATTELTPPPMILIQADAAWPLGPTNATLSGKAITITGVYPVA